MELPNDVVDDVRKRLRRAAGQVQAVERMLAEGRECRGRHATVCRHQGARTSRLQDHCRRVRRTASKIPRRPRPMAIRLRASSACS